jgi:GDP-L-fucose synthase
MSEKQTVLITGGSGLVGRALHYFKKDYPEYQLIFSNSEQCNLCNFKSTLDYFRMLQPDVVIHLAACVGGLFKNMNQKVDMLEKNLMINFNVLKCCHLTGVQKCISCLSTCIFPDKTTYTINEDMLHHGPPHHSNDSYAYAKRMLEIHSKAYQEQYGSNFICIIPTNIYGPHDNYHLEDAHVIPALIHKCYLAKRRGEAFVVRGSGKPLRQFIYSQDLARLIFWTLDSYQQLDTLILSVSEEEEISIKDVATYIAREFDYEQHMMFDLNYSDGQYKKTADNSKLINLIENFQFTPVQEGIHQSVKWFIEHYENCRK